MKKLLMASATLFLFSTSIMLFQMSCSKDANAGTNSYLSQGKMLTVKNTTPPTLQIVSTDGTKKDIGISLPNGLTNINKDYLACDGTNIWFQAYKWSGTSSSNLTLITCDMNGGNVKSLGSYVVDGDVFVAF
jgi:hypothetical protein